MNNLASVFTNLIGLNVYAAQPVLLSHSQASAQITFSCHFEQTSRCIYAMPTHIYGRTTKTYRASG